jgi:S-layer protein (TIGR01567 family)
MSKKILGAVLAAVMLLGIALPASAAIQATQVEVRGTVVNATALINAGQGATWDATDFAGFWYDLKNNLATENLNIQAFKDVRTIDKEKLWYNTTRAPQIYKVSEEKGLNYTIENGLDVNLNKASAPAQGNYYALVGWMAEKYVGINGKNNKLAKLVLEQEKADKKTLTVGETWDMGDGYTLTAQSIDAKATPRQAWLVLSKDGAKLDDKVINQGEVYTYSEKSLASETDVPIFVTYVDSVFAGATTDMVQLKYTWVISKSVQQIKSGDMAGIFKVDTETPLALKSDSSVTLSRDSTVDLAGNMKFKVADSPDSDVRFYPKVDYEISVGGPTPTPTGTPTGTPTPLNFTPTGTPTPLNFTPTITTPAGTAAAGTPEGATPAATTPTESGFESVFAIAGLLAVAYLVLRQKK